MRSEAVDRFWERFRSVEPSVTANTPFQIWHFGNTREMAEELVALVLSGKKKATASSRKMNEIEPATAPVPEGYSVVTDFDGDPRCVIRTSEIRLLPFADVDAVFAAHEGEGDLSLDHWRRVHWDYFTREADRHGFTFGERSIVCCERFRLLFPR